MRIAILSDIHGNLPAFEAALDHVRQQAVDQLIIAGDLINGAPDSRACWELAQTLDCTILRGNHERYVFDFDSPDAPLLWKSEQFGPVQWTVAQFTPAERQTLAALPFALRLAHAPELLFVHSSLRRDNENLQSFTPDAEISAAFAGAEERLIVRGHDHWSQVRLWAGRTIVTAGSVGMTLDEEPTARYLLLERRAGQWHFQHQAVPYDVEAVVERFYCTGYLKTAGPMARLLLREIALASPHVVPFLRFYAQWSAQEPITLSAAVDRFLRMY
jgi:predicted phosphodiesterase